MHPHRVRPPLSRLIATTASAAVLLLAALVQPAALAQMTVEITGVGSQQYPIAVAPFRAEASMPQDISAIIRADLARSGQFRMIDSGATPIAEDDKVDLGQWKARGADTLLVGSASKLADGRYDVRFRLYDDVKGGQLDALAYVSPASELRLTAHRIADRIYEKLTGDKGVFSTRIAYVVQFTRSSYELQVADADGANPLTALKSHEPIISPIWSADGNMLAYVSFETRKPVVYVHTLASGERRAVANFRGSNSAPAFSPDGKTVAVVLTKDGNSEIYTVGILQRRHRHRALLLARRRLDLLHVGPRRKPADLPDAGRRRGRAAHDLQRRLQHQPAGEPRWPPARLYFAAQRPVPGRSAGYRPEPGTYGDGYGQG
jgi:TolB protein